MTPELAAACERSVHVLTAQGEILRAGRAAMFIVERVSCSWCGRVLARRPFIWGVELGYWLVARNRALFSRFLFRKGS